MGTGTDEFKRVLGKWTAYALVLGLIFGAVLLYNQKYHVFPKHISKPEVKSSQVTSKHGTIVSHRVSIQDGYIETDTTLLPDQAWIDLVPTKDRERVVIPIHVRTKDAVPQPAIPKQPLTYGLGYIKSPTREGVAVTHGIIYLPWMFDMRLTTGLFCGKDINDNVTSAWMFDIGKEVIPNVEITVGELYNLDMGWEMCYGVRYCW